MKKYFLSIVALAGMLFATSCQESLVEPQMEGPTTFTVQLPDQMGTKAIGSKTNVNQLLVAVYQEASVDGATAIYRQTAEVKNGEATISLNLIKGQSYDVIFWAQKDNGYVDVNTQFELVNIPVENKHHNGDNGAAFFFYKENFVPSGVAESVTLKRPFAQLNLGTTAASLDTHAGIVAIETSAITVGNVATSFNTVLGYGQGEQTLVFAAKPEPQQELEVGNDKYVYVSMDYLPISGDDEAVVTVEAQITLNNTQMVSHKFTNVPVRENYRTNIVGNLISSSSEFTVKVDDSWAGADYNEEYVAPGIRLVNGEYEITSEEGLWSLAEIVNGGTKALTASDFSGKTIKLTCDIDLENEPWTPIGGVGLVHFSGVFDGNGYTISNLFVRPESDDDYSSKGFFGAARGVVKNLTLENVNVNGHYKVGALVGDGINAKIEACAVIGGSVISTPANGLKGNNVGGLVGYLYADGKSETYAFVNNCSVENLTVRAYSDVAGLVGTVGATSGSKEATVERNTIKNVVVIADQSVQYNETRQPNAGEVYGRTAGTESKITISNNTAEEVQVNVYTNGNFAKVKTIEELQSKVANATSDITVEFANDLVGNVTIEQKEGVNIVINGNGFKYDGTITIDGNARNTGTETLSFVNINFEHLSGSIIDFDFIKCNVAGNDGYAHNVTVKDCTFTGNSSCNVVGMRYRQCYNMYVINCTATDVHSLMWTTGGENITVDGVTVEGNEGGLSTSTTKNIVVKNSTINVDSEYGYGIRINSSDDNTDLSLQVIDCKITADAPILLRQAKTKNYSIALQGTNELTTSKEYHIIATASEYKSGTELVPPTGNVTFTGANEYFVYPREIYVAPGLFELQDDEYEYKTFMVFSADGLSNLNAKFSDQSAGKGAKVKLMNDIDFAGRTWTTVDSHADSYFWLTEIDGNNKTISNLTINGQAMFSRFAGFGDVTIKDLTFDKANVNSNGSINTSILTGQSYQNILLDNVDVKNSTILGGYKVAPLIATVYDEKPSKTITATLKNCDVKEVVVRATGYDFCTTGMVAFVYAGDNDKITFENCNVSEVKLYAPDDSYKAHAAIYTTGSESLYNEAEGVTVTNVTFEAK